MARTAVTRRAARSRTLGDYGDAFDDFSYYGPNPEAAPGTIERDNPIYSDLPLADAASEDSGAMASALQRLRDAQARFENAAFQMAAIGPEVLASGDADAIAEWQGLTNRANMVRDGMNAIASGTSDALDTVKMVFGLSAVRRVARSRMSGGRLGALPLIPIAAIAAAIGIVIAAANSMMQFVVNWSRANRGLKPVPSSGGIAEGIQGAADLVKWGGIAFAVYLLLPELLKMAKK